MSSTARPRVFGSLALVLALAAATVMLQPAPAHAFDRGWHGGGWGLGVATGLGVALGVDAALGWPGYYPPYARYGYPSAYPYYPGYVAGVPAVTVVQPAPAQVAAQPAAAAQAQPYYYCADPAGYYPYVQSCKSTWQMVPATPPGAAQ